MKRVSQVLVLVTLIVVAILAKTFDGLVTAAPAGQSQLNGKATIQFDGSVTKIDEAHGVLTINGTAVLSNTVGSLMGTSWQASAEIPFRRTANGTLLIARQGQLRINVLRSNAHFSLVANLANITSTINPQNGGYWVVVNGDADVVASDSDGMDWLRTAVLEEDTLEAMTMNAPTMDRTQLMGTVYFDWTQFPITQTPDTPRTQAPTSQPTFASPGL